MRCALFLLGAMLVALTPALRADEATLESLIKAVGEGAAADRIQAMDQLASEGSAAKAAVPALSEALGSDDEELAWHAARTLAALGPDAAEAVTALTAALANPSNKVQAYAAYALGEIGKAAEPATEALLERVFDEDLMVRRASVRSLLRIDPPKEKTRPVVQRLLSEGDPQLLSSALRTFAEEGKAALPRLCDALGDDKLCYWACLVLGEIGPDAAEAVPQVAGLLKRDDPDVRMQAAVTLGEIGKASAAAVPALVEALASDEHDAVKFASMFALGRIGVVNKSVVDTIIANSPKEKPLLRLVGVWALARLRPERTEGVQYAADYIARSLRSDDPQVRMFASRALVEFAAPPGVVGPALVEALKDAHPEVVANAMAALVELGPAIVPHLSHALGNPELRLPAAMLMTRLGPAAAAAVPALVEAVKAADEGQEEGLAFRRKAMFALAMVGPEAKEAVPALVELLVSHDREVRGLAAFALGKIGSAAQDAVPRLKERLQELDEMDRVAFVWALLEIVEDDASLAEMAVPLLTDALDNKEDLAREEAVRSLGKLGAAAQSAVPQLKKLQDDPSPAVQAAVAEALEKIGG